MQKIPTLFKRDKSERRYLTNEVNTGCDWVLHGEGVATQKHDGTCCMIDEGILYKRYTVKRGRTPPNYFIAAQEPDLHTGQTPGWVPILGGPEDRYHMEAFGRLLLPIDGTYELCGPKVQGNPEGLDEHILIPHGSKILPTAPRTHRELGKFLARLPIEGIVFHHEDGRMAKIRQKDFRRKAPDDEKQG